MVLSHEDMSTHFDRMYERDRHTETDGHRIGHVCISPRGKNGCHGLLRTTSKVAEIFKIISITVTPATHVLTQ